jgi:glyoxylase-like metal-dependent hydrolase (beta-lactamase superfamily II)
MADKRVFSDGTQTMELYRIHGSNHTDTMLIAYFPKDKLLVEGDLWNPPAQPAAAPLSGVAAAEPANLMHNIQRLKLDVAQIVPIHGRIVPFSTFQRALGPPHTTD